MTDNEIAAYLANEAPIPTGPDDFESMVDTVARHFFPYISTINVNHVAMQMQRHWLPRFGDDDTTIEQLFVGVLESRKVYDEEEAAREVAEAEARREARARVVERERAARRTADANKPPPMAEVAARMGVSERRAFAIKSRGSTANRRQAVILSEAFGGGVGDWYEPERQRGRKRDWATFLMREGAQEFPFSAFVTDHADGDDWRLFELAALFESGGGTPRDFATLSALVSYATDHGVDLGSAEGASQLWNVFADWRFDRINRTAKHGKHAL